MRDKVPPHILAMAEAAVEARDVAVKEMGVAAFLRFTGEFRTLLDDTVSGTNEFLNLGDRVNRSDAFKAIRFYFRRRGASTAFMSQCIAAYAEILTPIYGEDS